MIHISEEQKHEIWRRVCELHQESISAHTFNITLQACAEILWKPYRIDTSVLTAEDIERKFPK